MFLISMADIKKLFHCILLNLLNFTFLNKRIWICIKGVQDPFLFQKILGVCCVLYPVPLFATPWTVACQALLSKDFLGWNTGVGLLFPPLGDLPNSWIQPVSPALADRFFTIERPSRWHKGRRNLCKRHPWLVSSVG